MALTVWFELMDTASANMIATFATEAEALAFIRKTIAADGRAIVATWALAIANSLDDGALIAEGEGLADRALTFAAV